jgi:hypothetical protein
VGTITTQGEWKQQLHEHKVHFRTGQTSGLCFKRRRTIVRKYKKNCVSFESCSEYKDRLCGLVVRVLGYRSGGLGSIPGTTRIKKSNGSETGSTQCREYNWGATWEKSSGCCLENREYGRRDPSRWSQKLVITSQTSGDRSVGVVRSRTQTMEFSFFFSF